MLTFFKIEIVGFCMENGLSKIGVCQITPWVTLKNMGFVVVDLSELGTHFSEA